ncbi:hypothetical protein MHYP_G00270140 [Metynnis hypsauchen]
MDALQQPWTRAGQKGLLTSRSQKEMERDLQKKAMELWIENIQVMMGTRDVDKEQEIRSLEEMWADEAESVVATMRSNHHQNEFTLYDDGRNPEGGAMKHCWRRATHRN